MTSTGTGVFFDGITRARRGATVDFTPIAWRILLQSGGVLAEWPYNEIERLSAPTDVLRLGRKGSKVLAWLELHDPALIAMIGTPDELAGVVAHEMGHVSHRDGTRSALKSAGLSLLLGMLLGDFTGGGSVVVASRIVLQSAYSRDVEAAADAYGVKLMGEAAGNPRALVTILARIGGAIEPAMKILLDHPETETRVAAIDTMAGSVTGADRLDTREWAAVKRICLGS